MAYAALFSGGFRFGYQIQVTIDDIRSVYCGPMTCNDHSDIEVKALKLLKCVGVFRNVCFGHISEEGLEYRAGIQDFLFWKIDEHIRARPFASAASEAPAICRNIASAVPITIVCFRNSRRFVMSMLALQQRPFPACSFVLSHLPPPFARKPI